ncbi:MAG TPA: glycoside hydrolase family 127 protein [Candidatus Hydrogenedens sp.]|nr:glycoside hydrolase family 127 protein [Candidatus Hydrogenedens sp.]HOL20252.1 glycoside hydrolase family 127 protein [Candidatus Hydrogenedens sp.]
MDFMSISLMFVLMTMGAFEDMFKPIPLDAVKVSGEMGRRIDMTIYNNTMVMDIDGEFLEPFIKKENGEGGYVGIGKTIDALVRFAKYTNDPKVIERKNHVVKTLLDAQEKDGYIGLFKEGARVWRLWDIHEIAYIIYGLVMEYRFFGDESALEGARKAGDYLIQNMSPYPGRIPGDGDICWEMGTTGVETAMLCLYEDTKDAKYLDFVKNYMKLDQWDGPIIKGRWGTIQGHAYAHLKRCMAKMQLNRIETNMDLLKPSSKVLDFILKNNGLVIIGTCGQHECWHDTQEGSCNLGETCMTAYLIRWWDEWLRETGNPKFGDLMERAIYNALFGAQSLDGRKIRYYTPFEGKRVYFDQDSYCCPCNFRRIISELPQMIYYTNDKSIYINLFTPSKASLTVDNTPIEIEQETNYPSDGIVKIKISKIPKEMAFPISFRVPSWCKEIKTRIDNGDWIVKDDLAGGILAIGSSWKKGSVLEIDLGIRTRIIRGVQAQAGRVAVMYGPQVFCVSKKSNPALEDKDLRNLTIDPKTLEGPFPDDTVRKGGLKFTVKGWNTLSWYPLVKYDYENIVLTEFPDPDGEITYFHVPNPEDPLFEQDEFIGFDLSIK